MILICIRQEQKTFGVLKNQLACVVAVSVGNFGEILNYAALWALSGFLCFICKLQYEIHMTRHDGK